MITKVTRGILEVRLLSIVQGTKFYVSYSHCSVFINILKTENNLKNYKCKYKHSISPKPW